MSKRSTKRTTPRNSRPILKTEGPRLSLGPSVLRALAVIPSLSRMG